MLRKTVCKKKYWMYGLVGCICFGIGDWLLGYVDPTLPGEDLFYFIRVGHGADYNTSKGIITMVLAMAGMLFYLPGMVHISDIALDNKAKGCLKYTFALCSVGWFTIHFIVAVQVIIYSWIIKNVDKQTAYAISNFFGNATLSCLFMAYVFVGIPLILLIVYILRGKTALKKRDIIFTPLIWMAITGIIAEIIPANAFSYGLYTFCMNGGMLVWFLYLLVKHPIVSYE